MKKLTIILCSVLALQVLLSIILLTQKQDRGAYKSDQSLLEITKEALDSIILEEKGKPPLELKLTGNDWVLPGYFNMPVAKNKLETGINKLLGFKKGWPVAKTEEAAPRFKVAGNDYERKITFQKGGKAVKTLYLGSSPGFKKIHARVDGEKDIQSIEFSAFEVSVNAEDWMQRDLIKIDPEPLTHIETSGFSLAKVDDDWQVEKLAEDQITNADGVKSFLGKLEDLSYVSVLGVEEKPEYGLTQSTLKLVLNKDAKAIQYTIGKLKEQDDFVLKTSTQPYFFKVNKVQVDALTEVELAKLVNEKGSEGQDAKDSEKETGKLEAKP
ncbi:MAG: DUF4340 domain-containing protein [Methylococcaceae bacterium]